MRCKGNAFASMNNKIYIQIARLILIFQDNVSICNRKKTSLVSLGKTVQVIVRKSLIALAVLFITAVFALEAKANQSSVTSQSLQQTVAPVFKDEVNCKLVEVDVYVYKKTGQWYLFEIRKELRWVTCVV